MIKIHNLNSTLNSAACYRIPGRSASQIEWNQFFSSLSMHDPSLIFGDFNSHHTNCFNIDGIKLLNSIHDSDLILVNHNTLTHIDFDTRVVDATLNNENKRRTIISCYSNALFDEISNSIFSQESYSTSFSYLFTKKHVVAALTRDSTGSCVFRSECGKRLGLSIECGNFPRRQVFVI